MSHVTNESQFPFKQYSNKKLNKNLAKFLEKENEACIWEIDIKDKVVKGEKDQANKLISDLSDLHKSLLKATEHL